MIELDVKADNKLRSARESLLKNLCRIFPKVVKFFYKYILYKYLLHLYLYIVLNVYTYYIFFCFQNTIWNVFLCQKSYMMFYRFLCDHYHYLTLPQNTYLDNIGLNINFRFVQSDLHKRKT